MQNLNWQAEQQTTNNKQQTTNNKQQTYKHTLLSLLIISLCVFVGCKGLTWNQSLVEYIETQKKKVRVKNDLTISGHYQTLNGIPYLSCHEDQTITFSIINPASYNLGVSYSISGFTDEETNQCTHTINANKKKSVSITLPKDVLVSKDASTSNEDGTKITVTLHLKNTDTDEDIKNASHTLVLCSPPPLIKEPAVMTRAGNLYIAFKTEYNLFNQNSDTFTVTGTNEEPSTCNSLDTSGNITDAGKEGTVRELANNERKQYEQTNTKPLPVTASTTEKVYIFHTRSPATDSTTHYNITLTNKLGFTSTATASNKAATLSDDFIAFIENDDPGYDMYYDPSIHTAMKAHYVYENGTLVTPHNYWSHPGEGAFYVWATPPMYAVHEDGTIETLTWNHDSNNNIIALLTDTRADNGDIEVVVKRTGYRPAKKTYRLIRTDHVLGYIPGCLSVIKDNPSEFYEFSTFTEALNFANFVQEESGARIAIKFEKSITGQRTDVNSPDYYVILCHKNSNTNNRSNIGDLTIKNGTNCMLYTINTGNVIVEKNTTLEVQGDVAIEKKVTTATDAGVGATVAVCTFTKAEISP